MKKFRFSLQAVLGLREAEEQDAQRVFASALREREAVAGRLSTVEQELEQVWRDIRANAETRQEIAQLRRTHAWCLVLEDKQRFLIRELDKFQRQLQEAHLKLQEATRRRETMVRILERQRQSHDRQVQHEQQKFLDEVATRRSWPGRNQLEAV